MLCWLCNSYCDVGEGHQILDQSEIVCFFFLNKKWTFLDILNKNIVFSMESDVQQQILGGLYKYEIIMKENFVASAINCLFVIPPSYKFGCC